MAAGRRVNEEVEIARCTAGQYFGELALVTNKPRAASVYASGETRCLGTYLMPFPLRMCRCLYTRVRYVIWSSCVGSECRNNWLTLFHWSYSTNVVVIVFCQWLMCKRLSVCWVPVRRFWRGTFLTMNNSWWLSLDPVMISNMNKPVKHLLRTNITIHNYNHHKT